MTTLAEPRQTDTIGDGLPVQGELVLTTGRKIYEGGQVGVTAAGLAIDPAAGTAVAIVGIALHTVVGDGTKTIRFKTGVHALENSVGDAVSIANFGDIVYCEDDETICATSAGGTLAPSGLLVGYDATYGPRVYQSPALAALMTMAGVSAAALTVLLASVANGDGALLVGVEDAAGNFAATDVEAALAEIMTLLASTANGEGASLVGIEDAGTKFTGTDAEAALAECATTAEMASVAA